MDRCPNNNITYDPPLSETFINLFYLLHKKQGSQWWAIFLLVCQNVVLQSYKPVDKEAKINSSDHFLQMLCNQSQPLKSKATLVFFSSSSSLSFADLVISTRSFSASCCQESCQKINIDEHANYTTFSTAVMNFIKNKFFAVVHHLKPQLLTLCPFNSH